MRKKNVKDEIFWVRALSDLLWLLHSTNDFKPSSLQYDFLCSMFKVYRCTSNHHKMPGLSLYGPPFRFILPSSLRCLVQGIDFGPIHIVTDIYMYVPYRNDWFLLELEVTESSVDLYLAEYHVRLDWKNRSNQVFMYWRWNCTWCIPFSISIIRVPV